MHVAADSAVRGVVSGNSFTALLFIFTKYQFSMRVEHCIPAVALPCAQVDSQVTPAKNYVPYISVFKRMMVDR